MNRQAVERNAHTVIVGGLEGVEEKECRRILLVCLHSPHSTRPRFGPRSKKSPRDKIEMQQCGHFLLVRFPSYDAARVACDMIDGCKAFKSEAEDACILTATPLPEGVTDDDEDLGEEESPPSEEEEGEPALKVPRVGLQQELQALKKRVDELVQKLRAK